MICAHQEWTGHEMAKELPASSDFEAYAISVHSHLLGLLSPSLLSLKSIMLLLSSSHPPALPDSSKEVLHELSLSGADLLPQQLPQLIGQNLGTMTPRQQNDIESEEELWIRKYYETAKAYCDGVEEKERILAEKME